MTMPAHARFAQSAHDGFHERAPTVPLVAMSGYAFANLNSPAPDFLRMALDLGAARCLRKPFTPGALLAVVNECLAEARSRFSGVVQSNLATSGYSAVDRRRSFDGAMRAIGVSAIRQCVRIEIAAEPGKNVFTINYIGEDLSGLAYCLRMGKLTSG